MLRVRLNLLILAAHIHPYAQHLFAPAVESLAARLDNRKEVLGVLQADTADPEGDDIAPAGRNKKAGHPVRTPRPELPLDLSEPSRLLS